jgi:surface polysaccharide O-acyltransferase-like enzyme
MTGVIAIHMLATGMTAAGTTAPSYYSWLHLLLNALCVPAFIFLTGMLVWGADEGRVDRRWWLKRAKVFLPYVAWTVIYWVAVPTGSPRPTSLVGYASELGKRLLLGTGSYHLWFLPVLLMVYLLTPVARFLLRRSPELLPIAALALPSLFVLAARIVPPPAEAVRTLSQVAALSSYAAAGAWFASREECPGMRRWAVPAGLAGLALLVAQSAGVIVQPQALVTALGVQLLTICATSAVLVLTAILLGRTRRSLTRSAPVLAAIAGLSYGVYLVHALVLVLLREGMSSLGAAGLWGSPVFMLAAFAAVLGVTLLVVGRLDRAPITAWMV